MRFAPLLGTKWARNERQRAYVGLKRPDDIGWDAAGPGLLSTVVLPGQPIDYLDGQEQRERH
jgi:hypothetical protein